MNTSSNIIRAATIALFLGIGAADNAQTPPADPLRWLHAAAFTDVPVSTRDALRRRIGASPSGVPASFDSAAFLRQPDVARDLRPSTASGLSAYLDWELAFARGDADTGGARLARLSQSGCCAEGSAWQDFVALRAGYARRLALAPVDAFRNVSSGSAGVWRAFEVLAILETGATSEAQHLAADLPHTPAPCGAGCATGALVALAHASIAFNRAQRDAAHERALVALERLASAHPTHRTLVPALASDLAVLLIALSDSAAAAQALDLGERAAALPPGHPFAAQLDATRFTLLANDGETATAAERLSAMRARHGEQLTALAATAATVGLGEGALGFMRADHTAGLEATIRALDLHRAARGDTAPAAAEALNVIALNESALDRNDEAIAHYRDALAIREQALAPSHPLIAELTNNLSVVFHNLGRYDLAETFITRSLEIDRAFYGDDHEEVASDLSNLGAIYRAMGDAEAAIDMFRQAVDINTRLLGRVHRRTAIMYHGLGQAYLESGDNQAAFDSFATSVEIHTHVDANSRNIPIARHNLAKAAIELGQFALARDTLAQVLVRYADIYGDSHRNVAAGYRDLARAQAGLNELDAADDSLLTAAGLVARAEALEVQWRVFFTLAQQEARLDNQPSAIFFGKLALEVLQRLRASQSTLGRRLQRSFARQRADSYRQVALWLVDAGRLVEAQRVLEMLKDEEYFDFTRRAQNASGATVPFAALETRQRERLLTARARWRADDDGDPTHYRDTLSQVRKTLGTERREAPDQATPDAAPRPPQGAAYVAYVVGRDSTRVIVTTRSGQSSATVPAGRADLGTRVLDLRTRLAQPDADVRKAARALHKLLLRPVLRALRGESVDTLWLQLDDTLRYLPFAALHDGKRFLGEDFALIHMHGAQRPPLLQSAPRKRVAAFALTQAQAGFQALPAAAAEADGIVRRGGDDTTGVFPGRVWIDKAFTRESFRGALDGQYDMVHLASHFEFAPGNEKDSFLLLGDGARLSLYDLRTGDYALDGVRLLTMSGCNTALAGRDADGREIDGFATLAARKGARHILATLWPVEDSTTADFMARFYALHAAGMGFPEALRNTQLEFNKRRPFFWAPFVLWSAPVSVAPGTHAGVPGAGRR